MTVSNPSARAGPFACNGVTVDFPFTFPIFTVDDVVVTKVTIADGTEVTLTRGTDYNVTPATVGGTVTTLSAFSALYQIILRRKVDLTQEIDLKNQGDWFPETHEEAFDLSVMRDQQQQEEIDRSLKKTVALTFFDAQNLEIKNVANPTTGKSAVNNDALAASVAAGTAAAIAAAQAYVNQVIAGFLTNSTINGVVYETTLGVGVVTIPTPYTFTGGFANIGGRFINLKNTADCTLSGSPTTVTLTATNRVACNVIMFLF